MHKSSDGELENTPKEEFAPAPVIQDEMEVKPCSIPLPKREKQINETSPHSSQGVQQMQKKYGKRR